MREVGFSHESKKKELSSKAHGNSGSLTKETAGGGVKERQGRKRSKGSMREKLGSQEPQKS